MNRNRSFAAPSFLAACVALSGGLAGTATAITDAPSLESAHVTMKLLGEEILSLRAAARENPESAAASDILLSQYVALSKELGGDDPAYLLAGGETDPGGGDAPGAPEGGIAGPCPAAGDCCLPHGTPGCDDADCCNLICGQDAFCCNTQWDGLCSGAAVAQCDVCDVPPVVCGPGAGSCCIADGTPGCDDVACCEAICAADPFCCDTSWDSLCAGAAASQCASCGAAPASPDDCGGQTDTFSNVTPVAIPTTAPPIVVSSTIDVSGIPTHLWHLSLTTAITHTNNADLDVTLTSPAGTIVTLTTDNGGSNDNVYNGTIWTDYANPGGQVPPGVPNNGVVTDHTYANLTTASPLVPEEAFAAFIGEDPNGTWTLTISDDLTGAGGSLDSWSLSITTLPGVPAATTTDFTQGTDVAISSTGTPTVSSTLDVSGLDASLCDVNLTTLITHTWSADIRMTLQSPAGTVVTITTNNGGSNDNVFNGTLWDDDANPAGALPYLANNGLVTDHAYVNLVLASPLVPEEALGAFNGEDPNGTWTLTIHDSASADGGVLDSWTLHLTTCECTVACCFTDGSCADLSSDDCAGQGGNPQAPGTTCADFSCPVVCGPGAGDCFQPNGTVGCENAECCETVCAIDPFCCDVTWDSICADEAFTFCCPLPGFCDDGDVCTDDTCEPGVGCVHTPIDCDDGDLCTIDDCDPVDGCFSTPVDCSDGDNCTIDECDPADGSCFSTPVDCDDADDCTNDSCNPFTGLCVHQPKPGCECADDADCEDGVACTADVCAFGVCKFVPVDSLCNDFVDCTVDVCDPMQGCLNTPDNGACDDGDNCTVDTCDPLTGCANTPVDCDDADACTDDSCNPMNGMCVHTPVNCDDGDACTNDDCDPASGCFYEAVNCDDGDACTDDDCDPATGCTHSPTDCDDGDNCTNDGCEPGSGCFNIDVVCDDGIDCTFDFCLPATGACVSVPVDSFCDDHDACTTDLCVPPGGCQNVPIVCDDGDACTDDTCDPDTGCVFTLIVCDDSVDCTKDTCDPGSGCVYTPVDSNCDDSDACTIDVCDALAGCQYTPVMCDDGVACTKDSCDPGSGCVYSPDDGNCDDSDACTTDVCDALAGCQYTPVVCDDGVACTKDSCDPGSGCVYSPDDGNCDDSDACTNDVCDPIDGCLYTDVVCNDNDLCTIDTCDPATGCVFTPVDCDDGVDCTFDFCDDITGLCVNKPIDDACDDANDCTLDECDVLLGCVYTAVGCDDGDACTVDMCEPMGGCSYSPFNCSDGDACTTDLCDPLTGCFYEAVNCDDSNACTDDSCNPATGCVNDLIVCDDGDACTVDDCNPASGCFTTPLDCNDGDACTIDDCDPASGCIYSMVDCDDDDACTTDGCDPGSGCTHDAVNCDDADACTIDDCDPATGCIYSLVDCDDGDPCTNDSCDAVDGCVNSLGGLDEASIDVALEGGAAGNYTRCLQVRLVDCDGGPDIVFEQTVSFTDGGGVLSAAIACDSGVVYDCIEIKDPKHTLRRTLALDFSGGRVYSASATGALALVGGDLNNDHLVDILDFGVLIGFPGGLFVPLAASTSCPPAGGPHTDIDGNGMVDLGDVTFISVNLTAVSDDACCGGLAMWDGPEIAEPVLAISVSELYETGRGQLAMGDLNQDGILDLLDVAAALGGIMPDMGNAAFTGAESHDWFDAGNWSDAQVPAAVTNASIIDVATIADGAALAHDVFVEDGGVLFVRDAVLSAAHVTVHSGGTLAISGGVLDAAVLYVAPGATLRLDAAAALSIGTLILSEGAILEREGDPGTGRVLETPVRDQATGQTLNVIDLVTLTLTGAQPTEGTPNVR